jgi:hypothetical protein
MPTLLTPHFSLEVDFPSALHAPPEIVSSLRLLCEEVLEPVRVYLGRPVSVTSGWSASKVHVPGSQHGKGEASDIVCRAWRDLPALSSTELCWAIMNSGARWDQLIWYDAPDTHVHASFTRRRALRRDVLHRTKSGYEIRNPT